MPRLHRPRTFENPPFVGILCAVSSALIAPAAAAECTSAVGLSACFDANSLWLAAGRATFLTLPDTGSTEPGRVRFGLSTEFLHRPVQLHADSPDPAGREIRVIDSAVDASYFLSFGLVDRLELTLAAPVRVYQTGAGLSAISSQSGAGIERNAVRNPRLGLGYSLDDALGNGALGLRVGLEAAIPLAERDAFAGERTWVVEPNLTFGWTLRWLRINAGFGARLRSSVEFGGSRLGNQGFGAVGAGVELVSNGLLFVSVESFALPPLSESRGSTANPRIRSTRLFPAEWLAAVHSSCGTAGGFTLSLGAGSGIPLSSETEQFGSSSSVSHFLGLATPDFHALFMVRVAPELERARSH